GAHPRRHAAAPPCPGREDGLGARSFRGRSEDDLSGESCAAGAEATTPRHVRRAGCAVAARKVRRRRVDRRRGKWKRNVVALNLGLDLSTPQGELVANVIASVAQWERRIIGERIGG